MQSKTKTWATTLLLMLSAATAGAKPPADVGCAVLLPSAINTGLPYKVKVVRVPSYPGGWSRPTVTIDVVYPTTPDHVIGDTREQTILRHNVTYALATFTAPEAFDPDTSLPVIVAGGTVNVMATVKEPINKRKFKETTCSATTVVY